MSIPVFSCFSKINVGIFTISCSVLPGKFQKKRIAGQNSTKHSGNSDRLHAIGQKIAPRQAADIYLERLISPVSSETIPSDDKWNIPGWAGFFPGKIPRHRFLWGV
ncbi:MAG: hypothetical protein NT166_25030 [Candidatus Aminicenantes bacterium]|nr:hypothetical protein [Candidatus Aminicenantes bacterium]